MKDEESRRPWQRMTLSLLGVVIIAVNWRWAVTHLYSLPEHSIAGFTSITNNAAYVIGAIVVFMVTGKIIYDWKNKTEAVVNVTSEVRDEVSHIIEEGAPGSPTTRPWTPHATEEV